MAGSKTIVIKKLALYGDSLSMPRPGVVPYNERYYFYVKTLLEKKTGHAFEIIEKAKASITISELLTWVHHDSVYYPDHGEVFILHAGIVDCAPRPLDASMRKKVSRLPSFIRKLVIKYIHKNRAKLITRNGGITVTPIVEFESCYSKILDIATKTYSKVFVINICPTDEKTNAHSPGLLDNIVSYNTSISKCVKAYSGRVVLIDLFNMIKKETQLFNYILEDGHHITPLTHKMIFKEIEHHLA